LFAPVVNSLPEVCDFKILAEDVILKLIFADKEETLGSGLLQFVHVVLVLNVYGLFVHKEEALCQTDVIVVPFLASPLVRVISSNHALIAGYAESLIVVGATHVVEAITFFLINLRNL